MNKEIEKLNTWNDPATLSHDEIKSLIEKAIQQERQRITSIVQKEIAKSDKYQIEPLERIRYNINNYE